MRLKYEMSLLLSCWDVVGFPLACVGPLASFFMTGLDRDRGVVGIFIDAVFSATTSSLGPGMMFQVIGYDELGSYVAAYLHTILKTYNLFSRQMHRRFSPSVAISRIKERARRASCFDRKEIQPGQKKVSSRSMAARLLHSYWCRLS